MNHIKNFNDFKNLNEEFTPSDVKDFFKIIKLRNKLKTLDWDEYDDVKNLFYYTYPEEKLDKSIIHNLNPDNMIDILHRVSKLNTIPELIFDKRSGEVKIK